MNSDDRLLTPSEAAELLSVSPITLRQWASRGKLPFKITPGGHRRFLLSDINTLLSELQPKQEFKSDAQQSSQEDRLSLLIVDDNQELCEFLQVMLQHHNPNWKISIAHDGFDAGLKVQQLQPQVMLVDLNLPGINGDELCRNIKSVESLKNIKIIGMSGLIDEQGKLAFLQAGAEIVLQKPITQDVLIDSIKSITKAQTTKK